MNENMNKNMPWIPSRVKTKHSYKHIIMPHLSSKLLSHLLIHPTSFSQRKGPTNTLKSVGSGVLNISY